MLVAAEAMCIKHQPHMGSPAPVLPVRLHECEWAAALAEVNTKRFYETKICVARTTRARAALLLCIVPMHYLGPPSTNEYVYLLLPPLLLR